MVVALVVVVVSVVLATQAFGSSGPDYRVATVARHDVDATLTGVGTIEPVSQATVAFPVSGTVASVAVRVGDVIVVGSTLASLDTDSLQQTVHQKQAALAQAQLTLSRALAGESVSGATGGAGATRSGGRRGRRGRRRRVRGLGRVGRRRDLQLDPFDHRRADRAHRRGVPGRHP